jgi:hypothetical protein
MPANIAIVTGCKNCVEAAGRGCVGGGGIRALLHTSAVLSCRSTQLLVEQAISFLSHQGYVLLQSMSATDRVKDELMAYRSDILKASV